jgi:uncharacterized short protein YbdD (DUF466 family)
MTGVTTGAMTGAAVRTVARAWRAVRWYVRESTGEAEYDRFTESWRAGHPGEPVPSRSSFERRRQDQAAGRPQQRCC